MFRLTRMKLDRAKQRMKELEEARQSFYASDPFKFSGKADRNRSKSRQICCTPDFPLCSGRDLNPPLGFYFPLFSMSFAREFPSGWQSVEGSGIKIVVFL